MMGLIIQSLLILCGLAYSPLIMSFRGWAVKLSVGGLGTLSIWLGVVAGTSASFTIPAL
jgi:hypothetical protein